MHETAQPGSTVEPDQVDTISGGAGEGDCITPDTPDQTSNDSPWWRSLQDALGNLLK